VKIQPNLAAWLASYTGRTGAVSPPGARKLTEEARTAAKLTRWPNNGLRHSFASYHVAHFGDAARTALEMGHAHQQMLFSTYRERVEPEAARAYWEIMPANKPGNVIELPTVSGGETIKVGA
jgi:integrase